MSKLTRDHSQNENHAAGDNALQRQQTASIADHRPATQLQQQLGNSINSSPRQTLQRKAIERVAQKKGAEEEDPLQGRFVTQRQGLEKEPLQGRFPIQRQENKTGMPDQLKSGIESLSGMDMSGVKVHKNSGKPAQLNALAYAQGNDIHLGPGQEKHLPHEAWHVVQQRQGRVKATTQLQGAAINDDKSLESEADVMGGKAMQMKVTSPVHEIVSTSALSPLQKKANSGVMQRALATVSPQNGPVKLEQQPYAVASPVFVMRNVGQLNGQDVSNDIGFTGILNEADWAGLGKSPTDYHRAHGYANTFGGAGDHTNVAWWPTDQEDQWTEYEKQVRGTNGNQQIDAWKPGAGEKADFTVERELQPQKALIANYAAGLKSAVNWAFQDSNAAWQRVVTWSATNSPRQQKGKEVHRFPMTHLKQEKTTINNLAPGRIDNWVNGLFNNAETNLIKKMKMTYTTTTAGLNKGGSRADTTHQLTAANINPANFGLKNNPAQIWAQMVAANNGNFSKNGNPLNGFTTNVNSLLPHDVFSLELKPLADGWGV